MLELIILTSIFTQGLFVIGQDPYILAPLRLWLASKLGGLARYDGEEVYFDFNNEIVGELWKPFWGCPTCMASFWGLLFYVLFFSFSVDSLWQIPMLCVCASALNFIIFNNLIKKWL